MTVKQASTRIADDIENVRRAGQQLANESGSRGCAVDAHYDHVEVGGRGQAPRSASPREPRYDTHTRTPWLCKSAHPARTRLTTTPQSYLYDERGPPIATCAGRFSAPLCTVTARFPSALVPRAVRALQDWWARQQRDRGRKRSTVSGGRVYRHGSESRVTQAAKSEGVAAEVWTSIALVRIRPLATVAFDDTNTRTGSAVSDRAHARTDLPTAPRIAASERLRGSSSASVGVGFGEA